MGGFEDKVRGVLSDTMNLPDDFLSMIPQYVAQNPVPLARTPGARVAHGTTTANVATAGITFGTGLDVLASGLAFSADGSTDYVLNISADGWVNSGAGFNALKINLDGADAGEIASAQGANRSSLGSSGIIVKPSRGSHTVNVRLVVTAGTGTILGGAGGAGVSVPILVTLEIA